MTRQRRRREHPALWNLMGEETYHGTSNMITEGQWRQQRITRAIVKLELQKLADEPGLAALGMPLPPEPGSENTDRARLFPFITRRSGQNAGEP